MDKQRALRNIVEQVQFMSALYEDLPIFVVAARQSGATWEQIGRALGVSKQAAQQKYSQYVSESSEHR